MEQTVPRRRSVWFPSAEKTFDQVSERAALVAEVKSELAHAAFPCRRIRADQCHAGQYQRRRSVLQERHPGCRRRTVNLSDCPARPDGPVWRSDLVGMRPGCGARGTRRFRLWHRLSVQPLLRAVASARSGVLADIDGVVGKKSYAQKPRSQKRWHANCTRMLPADIDP